MPKPDKFTIAIKISDFPDVKWAMKNAVKVIDGLRKDRRELVKALKLDMVTSTCPCPSYKLVRKMEAKIKREEE